LTTDFAFTLLAVFFISRFPSSVQKRSSSNFSVCRKVHCRKCFGGCDNGGIEPYNIRWPVPLNAEQRRWLVYSLRHLIYEYEQCTDEDYRNDEGKIDERWKIQDALELKLMKNARHKLLTSYSVSKKTLFDPIHYFSIDTFM
jgi:hypothetical protein